MLKTFEGVTPFVKKLAAKSYSIDNWVFKLHYRASFLMMLACTVLVCSRQYIGEHIHCIADSGVPEHVMNTFCFFTSTFTLIKDYDSKMLDRGNLPHPGVGSYGINSKEELKRHSYYQWVPFVLFGQALMFYVTHMVWKKIEGGRIKYLVDGLQLAVFSLSDKCVKVQDKTIPSVQDKQNKINLIKNVFLKRLYISGKWSMGLIICEILNFFNVILQIYITNKFLNGEFINLGVDLMKEGIESSVDPLDEVFPKVTKCSFQKYGPSGTIQWHDALCVMALNVVNDKIYTFLWFWYVILFICTSGAVIWRFLTILLHSKSVFFNKMVYATPLDKKVNPWDIITVSQYCSYTDWLFLRYLSKNLDNTVFNDILISLATDLDEINHSDEESDKAESFLSDPKRYAVENEYKLS